MLATGVLRGPYGVHGFIKFFSFSQEITHLKNLESLLLKKEDKEIKLTLEELKTHNSTFLIKFKEINSPEEAKKLNGYELWISREEAQNLKEGEYYTADLIDCKILLNGKNVGTVISAIDGPQALLLEVHSLIDDKKYLIPFMNNYIGKVDLKNNEIELLEEQLIQ
ncbi:MAG: ribosome maturation factor RimM [Sphaerochaetaceae bacterium]